MTGPKSGLDAAFVQQQRQALLRLRASLMAVTQSTETEETDERNASLGSAVESEDDAQRLDVLERDDNLVARAVERLTRVDRALRKIDEGTYGSSDLSGRAIPRERLEAVPEALFTLDEEKARERG
jgi:DnaK suppressor protein